MDKNCGRFRIEVWEDGFPKWIILTRDEKPNFWQFTRDELLDLEYLINRAKSRLAEIDGETNE